MLCILLFLWIFFVGYVLVNTISVQFHLLEKIGLSLPFGFSLMTFFMLGINFCNLRFNLTILTVVSILFITTLLFHKKSYKSIFKPSWSIKNTCVMHWTGWLLLGILGYILYVLVVHALFWPTTDNDAIAGYDYMAQVLAAEGTFNNSIFDPANPTLSIRHNYPPFVPGSFAITYMVGLTSSKIFTVLMVVSLCLFFGGTLRRYLNATGALFFTLLLVTVPNFWELATRSYTNIHHTLFASTGLIALFEYLQYRERHYLVLGSILIAFNVWTRSEGVVFIAGGALILFCDICEQKLLWDIKGWCRFMLYIVVSSLPFVLWHLYIHLNLPLAYPNVFHKVFFWDQEKFFKVIHGVAKNLSNIKAFGLIFILFPIIVLLDIKSIKKQRAILLSSLFFSFLLLVFLYYQINNQDTTRFNCDITFTMLTGFHRGIFPFLPGICFYMASSPMVIKSFDRLYKIKIGGEMYEI